MTIRVSIINYTVYVQLNRNRNDFLIKIDEKQQSSLL